jgi:hypothetical protein
VLVHPGTLIRAYHDAAATFPWAGREWCFEPRQPVETVCHNELFPQNTVFRSGMPVVFIDWDTAAPGPRAWDIGVAAWRWVPFFRDEKCRATGLPTGVAEKARRFRLLLGAYGLEPDTGIVRAGIARAREFLGLMQKLAADLLSTRSSSLVAVCSTRWRLRSRGWRSTRLRSSRRELSHPYRRVAARRRSYEYREAVTRVAPICRASTADGSDHSRRRLLITCQGSLARPAGTRHADRSLRPAPRWGC